MNLGPLAGDVGQHQLVPLGDRLHPGAELRERLLDVGRRLRGVLLQPLLPGVAHLLLADAVEEVHDHAARDVLGHHLGGGLLLLREIEAADVDLDEELRAQAQAVERQGLAADLGLVGEGDAGERAGAGRQGEGEGEEGGRRESH